MSLYVRHRMTIYGLTPERPPLKKEFETKNLKRLKSDTFIKKLPIKVLQS